MAYIKLPEIEEMDPEIQALAKEILKKTGKLGEIFQLLALRKDIYFMTDNCVKTLLLSETELPYKTKERIALLISKENNCPMCVDVHKNIAKMLGMDEKEIEEAVKGIEYINAPEEEKELLKFCIRASRKDNYKITKEEIDRIKSLGYTDTQILEAITITAYFNYINTLSNVFGLGK
ncbi:MAG: carboxymuconolactone decarboxylase family protein [Aquificae bacterium]|nr:carboxymuconolactone decarboxylase family protein [Aquificota bacterium]